MRRGACIDIGSNTTRLLIADHAGPGALEIVREERALNRIVHAAGRDGTLPAEKVAELVAVVARQRLIALESGATEIVCVATAGLRRLANRDLIVRLIGQACDGLEVRILDGEQEARYAFCGAAWACGRANSAQPMAVVDVGGGSSELVVGVPTDGVIWSRSVALGSADGPWFGLTDDPPSAAAIERAREQIRVQILHVAPPPVSCAVAVGGSAGTLMRVANEALGVGSLQRVMDQLSATSTQEFASTHQLEVDRVEMLPMGLLLLQAASELFGVPLEVVAGGLREGVLLASDYQ